MPEVETKSVRALRDLYISPSAHPFKAGTELPPLPADQADELIAAGDAEEVV